MDSRQDGNRMLNAMDLCLSLQFDFMAVVQQLFRTDDGNT